MASGDNFDFSFSGIKTAVFNLSNKIRLTPLDKAEIASKFQDAVCEVLVKKTQRAASEYPVKSIIVGGGVAANSKLRRRMTEVGQNHNIKVFFPDKVLAVDNGAMIAAAAHFSFKNVNPLSLNANPSLHL